MSMTSQYFLTDYLTYRFNIETYCLRSETVKFCKNERNLVRVIYKWLRKSFILFRFIFIVVGSYERGEEYNWNRVYTVYGEEECKVNYFWSVSRDLN